MNLGKHTRSENIGHGMPLSPLNNVHRVKRRRVWLSIIALGKNTQSEHLRHEMLSSPLECTHGQMMLGVEMLSSPFGSTHGRMTSSIKCHYIPMDCTRYRMISTWHAIKAFGLHTQLERVGLGMPACSLGSIHGRTTSGVECHQVWHVIIALRLITRSDNIMCGMPSSVILRKCILTQYILNFPQF